MPSNCFSSIPVKLISLLLIAGVVMIAGCSDDPRVAQPVDACPKKPVNPSLVSVFYWGYDGSLDWAANTGTPISGVRAPTWRSSDEIVAATGTRINAIGVDGLVLIKIDESTQEYVDHQFYSHSDIVLQTAWSAGADTFAILDLTTPTTTRVSLAHLSQDQVVIDTIIADEQWFPLSVAVDPTGSGFFITAIEPGSSLPGIFHFYKAGTTYADSVVYTDEGFIPTPSGVAVDATGALFFERREPDGSVSVVRIDLGSPADREKTVMVRNDPLISIDAHPTEPGTLVLSHRFPGDAQNIPRDVIEVVKPPYTQPITIDSRTDENTCRFLFNGKVSWDPAGIHLAFPAGTFTGEGSTSIPKLWVSRNASN